MTASNFPSVPLTGDTFLLGEVLYKWNGSSWIPTSGGVVSKIVDNTTGIIDLSQSHYHRMSALSGSTSISFTNIPSGSSKFTLEINVDPNANAPWKLQNFSYANVRIIAQDASVGAVRFKPDGKKMFTLGFTNDTIYAYDLATPWNVDTAVYNNESVSVASQDSLPIDIFFSPTGHRVYMLGQTGRDVQQYQPSTAWSLVSMGTGPNFSIIQDTLPRGLFFKPDGTKMYVVAAANDMVYQYTLSTAWSIATTSYDGISFSIAAQETAPTKIEFTPDGKKMFIVGNTGYRIYQYSLSTAWDISTASYDNVSLGVPSSEFTYSTTFNTDGTQLYLFGTNPNLYRFSIALPNVSWPENLIWDSEPVRYLSPDSTIIVDFYTSDGGTTIFASTRFNSATT